MATTAERIEDIIASSDVVLFMKGIPAAPQCGFSAAVVQVLAGVGVPYRAVDVLQDPMVREGIKAFSNWPTIPQLYIKGEFVGGCDIVREMFQAGWSRKKGPDARASGPFCCTMERPRKHARPDETVGPQVFAKPKDPAPAIRPGRLTPPWWPPRP
jgi:monothiol glutaredoxin